jgi:hypothetical protein
MKSCYGSGKQYIIVITGADTALTINSVSYCATSTKTSVRTLIASIKNFNKPKKKPICPCLVIFTKKPKKIVSLLCLAVVWLLCLAVVWLLCLAVVWLLCLAVVWLLCLAVVWLLFV